MTTDTPALDVRSIPLSILAESPLNPRRTFDQASLDDLTASIATNGVLQPILVRPDRYEGFEVVCGARRLRAAIAAGLAEIPAVVRELDDAAALEAMVVENSQRSDVHPIEEADGYVRLRQLAPKLSVEDIAARVGKSASVVWRRLQLRHLVPAAREACLAGHVTPSVAELLARVEDPEAQAAALKAVLPRWDGDQPRSVTEARTVILRYHTTSLIDAPFDLAAGDLHPTAGPCTTCPRRAGNALALFGDLGAHDCTLRTCYDVKVAAHSLQLVARARESGTKVLEGDEAEKVFPSHWNDTPADSSPYVLLDESPDPNDHQGELSWRDVLGKHAPAAHAVVVRPNGRPVEVWDRRALAQLAKKHKLRTTVPQRPTERMTSDKERNAAQEAERRRKLQEQVEDETERRCVERALAAAECKSLDAVIGQALYTLSPEGCEGALRLGSASKSPRIVKSVVRRVAEVCETGAVPVGLVELLTRVAVIHERDYSMDEFGRFLGLDWEAIYEEVKKEMTEEPKAAPAAKKRKAKGR